MFMKKTIFFPIILAFLLLFSVSVYANTQTYCNGGSMFCLDNVEYYIQSEDEDKLYSFDLASKTEEKILDEHIISMVCQKDCLYLLAYEDSKSKLLCLQPSTDTLREMTKLNTVVSSIALRGTALYYVQDGDIYMYDTESNENTLFLSNGNTRFLMLSDENTLTYYTQSADAEGYTIYDYDFTDTTLTGGRQLMGYSPRLSAPDASNIYYKHTSYGGVNECIHISGGSVLPNCVGYAWGRSYESLGRRPNLSKSNAENWYSYNVNTGYYPYGRTPALGAVLVWAKGAVGNGNDGAGHVAVVEVINGGSIITSESGYGSFYFKTFTRSGSNYGLSSPYSFLGFIYVHGTNASADVFHSSLDSPANNIRVDDGQTLLIQGWAVHSTGVKYLTYSIDGSTKYGDFDSIYARSDVSAAFPDFATSNSCFTKNLSTQNLKGGYHSLTVYMTDNNNKDHVVGDARTFEVPYLSNIDTIYCDPEGVLHVKGWGIHRSKASTVKVYIDGKEAEITYSNRSDVAAAHPDYNTENAGFSAKASICGLEFVTIECRLYYGSGENDYYRFHYENRNMNHTHGALDNPATSPYSNLKTLQVSGWGLYDKGIDRFELYIQDELYTDDMERYSRPDLNSSYGSFATAHGGTDFPLAGFVAFVPMSEIIGANPNLDRRIRVRAIGNGGAAWDIDTRTISGTAACAKAWDYPIANSAVTDAVEIKGWYIDQEGVESYIAKINGKEFVLDTFQQTLSDPVYDAMRSANDGYAKAGFKGIIDISSFPKGTLTLEVIATTKSGNTRSLGKRTVTKTTEAYDMYTVSYDIPENGILRITANDAPVKSGVSLPDGASVTVIATPNMHYELISLSVNGTPLSSGSSFNLSENTVISASFAPISLSVTVKTDSEIVIESKATTTYLEDYSFILSVKKFYVLDTLHVTSGGFEAPFTEKDGVYTITADNIAGDIVITATQKLATLSVSYIHTTGGRYQGHSEFSPFEDYVFYLFPDAGMVLDTLSVTTDGIAVTPHVSGNQYIVKAADIQGDIVISPVFTLPQNDETAYAVSVATYAANTYSIVVNNKTSDPALLRVYLVAYSIDGRVLSVHTELLDVTASSVGEIISNLPTAPDAVYRAYVWTKTDAMPICLGLNL